MFKIMLDNPKTSLSGVLMGIFTMLYYYKPEYSNLWTALIGVCASFGFIISADGNGVVAPKPPPPTEEQDAALQMRIRQLKGYHDN